MIPIKFMVYNTISKEWTYFDTPRFDWVHDKLAVTFTNVTGNKLMLRGYTEPYQFTGQQVYEQEIYGGHILCDLINDSKVEVYFEDGGFMVQPDGQSPLLLFDWLDNAPAGTTIIGHRATNPDMLEATDDT